MVMTAALAVLFGAERMWLIRGRHLERVALHDRGLLALGMWRTRMTWRVARATDPAERWQWAENLTNFEEQNRPWIAYHERMKAKYLRAARYPWLSVEPDPPDPAHRGPA
jgi:hypothetical protein